MIADADKPKYIVVEPGEHSCCFDASVHRRLPDEFRGFEVVCDCATRELAELVAELLNARDPGS